MKELKKSTRREPVSRKKNTAEKKEQTAKKISTREQTSLDLMHLHHQVWMTLHLGDSQDI